MKRNFTTLAVSATGGLCVALASALVLAGAPRPDPATSASSAAAATPTNAAKPSEDVRAAKAVAARLKADPDHLFRHVNVHVQDGVARLSGFVYSADALYRARRIASETPGVTNVVDQMRLERNGNPADAGD